MEFLKSASVVCATVFALGCGSDTGPPPAGGYHPEPVSYEPPPMVNAAVIDVPRMPLPEAGAEPMTIDLSERLSPREELAFEGVIEVPNPEQAGGIVYIQFSRPGPGGRRIITQTGQQLVSWKDSPDGHIHFHVEMTAPVEPGRHEIEMQLLHRGPEPLILARGETEIESTDSRHRSSRVKLNCRN